MKKKSIILLLTCTLMGLTSFILSGCSKDDDVVVPKIDPIITWENPADFSAETPLSATQLNAMANVEGTFVYTPAINTILNVGANQTLKVDFTPSNTAKYNSASKSVNINVIIRIKVENNLVAGTLAAVATSYLSTISNLTITGSIDARDFKTMRDAMPNLKVIDLSGATIAAYTGTEGTNGTISSVYPANEIPENAFYNSEIGNYYNTRLKSFIFPTSATSIGIASFKSCSGLTGSLIIPSSVTTIGNYAFANCGFTGNLTMPSSITTIGDGAFANCRFTGNLTIPSSIKTIGNGCFSNCQGFTGDLTIPSSVTTIDGNAFAYCRFTGNLTIPSSVTTIGNGCFSHCYEFTGSLIIPSSVTSIGIEAFRNCFGFTGSLTISPSITIIDSSAFIGCSGLTGQLSIPSSVKIVSYNAFAGCSGLTGSITIPSSVTSIEYGAFEGLTGFIEVDDANLNYSSLEGVLFDKDKSILIRCPISKTGNYSIPSTVYRIPIDAFYGCKGLTGTLTIPPSVDFIESRAFCECTGLTSIIASSTTPIPISWSQNVFSGVKTATCTLHVPVGSKALYQAADQWKDFAYIVDDIVLP